MSSDVPNSSTIRQSVAENMEGRHDSISTDACGFQLCFGKRIRITTLQIFAKSTWALVFISFAHFLDESVTNGLFGVTLTTVEKQFQIRSSESGYIGAMMDVGAALTVILSAYYGEQLPKPRSIGISLVVAGIGCFIYITPQLSSIEDRTSKQANYLCGNVTTSECHSSSLRNYRFIFMLGMLLCGCGIEYPPTLGVAYLDENTSQARSSLFNGILYGAGGFGPLFGYMAGAASLRLISKPTEDAAPGTILIGSWWLGFLIIGSALILSSFPIYLLPEKLKNSESVRCNREQRIATQQEMVTAEDGNYKERLKALLCNPVYVFISLWVLMYECLVYAIATYAVKLISELLGMDESTAGFLLGGLGVGVSVVGYVLGGLIVSKFNLKLRGIVRFVFCCNVISFIFVFGFLLPCPEKEFAGIDFHDGWNQSLLSSCNAQCDCSMDNYFPVCDDRGIIYYSPCHAGCESEGNGSVFIHCKCIDGSNATTVSSNNCREELCGHVYSIFAVMVISMFSGYITAAPSVQATIRSVAFEERTMALSIQHIVLIICGRVLGRVMFAECFDNACMISSSECGEVGACRLYNKSILARNITILLATVKFLGVIFAGLALFFVSREKGKRNNSGATFRNSNVEIDINQPEVS